MVFTIKEYDIYKKNFLSLFDEYKSEKFIPVTSDTSEPAEP